MVIRLVVPLHLDLASRMAAFSLFDACDISARDVSMNLFIQFFFVIFTAVPLAGLDNA
jgi:hypothetical protein